MTDVSRRDFLTTSLVGAAGLSAGVSISDAQSPLPPEDGYKLWLRYAPPGEIAATYRRTIRQIVVEGDSPTLTVTRHELTTALASMLGSSVPAVRQGLGDGAVLVGTPKGSAAVRGLGWGAELAKLGPEGFVIRRASIANHPAIVIASDGDTGALYGAFHFLRLMQTGQPIDRLNVSERPKVQLRMLNHWDNLDGTIERGYAGRSLWQWNELPGTIRPRYADYARANASIGINASVVNSVNADVRVLSAEYNVCE